MDHLTHKLCFDAGLSPMIMVTIYADLEVSPLEQSTTTTNLITLGD